jgi:hypothetical protein
MAVEWIKPSGKTQAELDAEATALARERDVAEAHAYLKDTDHQIIKAAEALLSERGAIDRALLDERQAARDTISTAKQQATEERNNG